MPFSKELILDFALDGQWSRLGHVDAGVFEILAVVDADGNEAAGFGVVFAASPFQHADGAQLGNGRIGVGDLAGILGGGGKRADEQECDSPP